MNPEVKKVLSKLSKVNPSDDMLELSELIRVQLNTIEKIGMKVEDTGEMLKEMEKEIASAEKLAPKLVSQLEGYQSMCRYVDSQSGASADDLLNLMDQAEKQQKTLSQAADAMAEAGLDTSDVKRQMDEAAKIEVLADKFESLASTLQDRAEKLLNKIDLD